MTPITAYSTNESELPGHISLYRIFPEIAKDEDGRSNAYSFEDLKTKMAGQGFPHSVEIPNDQRTERRIRSAVEVLENQSDVGLWTGAMTDQKLCFFFQRTSDAVAFKLSA